ncbi:hypothetical protein I7I51_02190 [Histoplasma capsulatum]|uniref:WW domain-containing protein n=3 Tax=Histoplasma TaxID=5036 RepID=A0A8A1MCK3_AJECA|nr:hypothetical protein I7I51_02190 [Histoplasma capsulatum]
MPFAPPAGPPPPRVPDGWVVQFDDKYKEWFYVNLKTGISQWERPPVPDTLPPSYDQASPATTGDPATTATAAGDEAATGDVMKTSTITTSSSTRLELGSNNPYNPARSRSPSGPATRTTADSQMIDEDAKLAAKLQAEEDERAQQGHEQGQQKYAGSPPSHPQLPPQQQYQQQEQQQQHPHSSPPPPQHWQQPQETKRSSGGGFFGKLLNKASAKVHHGSSNSGSGSGFAPPHNYNQPYQQQPYQQYQPSPYPGPHGYNGYPPGAAPAGGAPFYGPQQPYAPGPPPKQRKRFGGIGPGGAAALGLGGGLLGGALLADAIGDHYDYQEGYEDGLAAGDFGGGDFGGGDF